MKKVWFSLILSILFLNCFYAQSSLGDEATFDFVRVFKGYSTPPSGWDPRVSIYGVVVDPENDNYEDYLHWPKSNGSDISVVDYYYNYPIPSNIIDLFGFDQAVRNAFAEWDNISGANIECRYQGTTSKSAPSDPPWAEDGMNIVSFSFNTDEVAGFDVGVVGKTLLSWNNNNELIDCDIILNASVFNGTEQYTWTLGTMDYDNNQIDFQSVLTHEIGHLLGVAHPYTNGNRPPDSQIPVLTCPTMFAKLSPAFVDNLRMRTLEDYDKNCARFLYPVLIEPDNNDTWDTAQPIGQGTYTGTIIAGDYDWFVISLARYQTLKAVIIIPDEFLTYPREENLDMFLCRNPWSFDPSNPQSTHAVSVYSGAQIRYWSHWWNSLNGYYYETVYAHTVDHSAPIDNYYILIKGKDNEDIADYTLYVWVSDDGDGVENSQNRTDPIPPGDGMDDSWEITYGLDPTNMDDGMNDDDNDGLINAQEFDCDSNPTNPDTDSDLMPDLWEFENHLQISVDDALIDKDNDGYTNLDEFYAGTDPNDAQSLFKIENITILSETGFGGPENALEIFWQHNPDKKYDIYYSDDLRNGFTLLEELAIDNEGVPGPSYIDQGFPYHDEPDAGSIRCAPLNNDSGERHYKIIVK